MFLQGSDGVEVVDALVLRRVGGGAQGLAPGTLLGKVAAAQLLRQHLVQKVAFLGDGHGLFQRGGQHFQPKALGLAGAEQVLVDRRLQHHAVFDAVQTGGQHQADGQIRVAGVVFLVKAAQAEQLLAPLNEQGVLLLSKPFSNTLFVQAMHMAAASNHRLQRLRQENARLQDKISQIRLVSRAKCCLVEHAHLTEAEAHRRIEKLAMDTRRDRTEIAQEILDSYEDVGV